MPSCRAQHRDRQRLRSSFQKRKPPFHLCLSRLLRRGHDIRFNDGDNVKVKVTSDGSHQEDYLYIKFDTPVKAGNQYTVTLDLSALDDVQKQFDVYKAKMESLLISQLELLKEVNKE